MSIMESKFELSKILSLLAILVVIATIIMYAIPQIQYSKEEFTCEGYVIDIEFLGGAAHPQTLVRFDNDSILLFYSYEVEIPLNKEVIFHYHHNWFGKLILDRFEVVK